MNERHGASHQSSRFLFIIHRSAFIVCFMVDAETVEKEETGALLEARGLRFAYAEGSPEVVRGASLAVARGKLSALVGANGSGKSTLVRLLGGLLKPAGGEVLFDGAALASVEPRVRARRIAY